MEPIRYVSSWLTFYLKGEIKSEQNFITFKKPNTVLGLIPLGAKSDRIAVNQIASTSTNFKIRLGKLIIGLMIAIAGIPTLLSSFIGGLVILIIGANCALNACEVLLIVASTAGQQKEINFFIFEKSKAELAEQQINAMICGRLDDTNTRQQTDRIIDAINNK